MSFYVFGFVPLLLLASVAYVATIPGASFGTDFQQAFWPAGHAVLHGRTPYPPVSAMGRDIGLFVYPPIVAIAVAPMALLPVGVATALALVVTLGALAAALVVLGVTDWRCYGVALASPAVLGCMQTAALSGLIALAIALAWRFRARGPATLALVALAIAVKLFLWPLLFWVLVVRGARYALVTGLSAIALVVLPWALGFPGFSDYPALLSRMTKVEGDHAYTVRALALALGANAQLAEASALLVGGAVLVLAAVASRRPDAARRVFALTLLASLLLSPVVWSHSFVVLLPIVAIGRPRLGLAWLAPLALWLGGGQWDAPGRDRIALGLAAMVVAALPGLVSLRSREGAGGVVRLHRASGPARPDHHPVLALDPAA
jgi:alpha-1,2-mannosyltransferase